MESYIQYVAWILGLVELIFSLYILYLNPRHAANRWSTLSMLLVSTYTFSLGSLSGAANASQAQWPTLLLAGTRLALAPALLLAALYLFLPKTFHRPRSPAYNGYSKGSRGILPGLIRAILVLLIFLPFVITLFDAYFTLNDLYPGYRILWYTGARILDLPIYSGGYLLQNQYTGGLLGPYLSSLYDRLLGSALALFLLYACLFSGGKSKGNDLENAGFTDLPAAPGDAASSGPLRISAKGAQVFIDASEDAAQQRRRMRLTALGLLFACLIQAIALQSTYLSVTTGAIGQVYLALLASLVCLLAFVYAAFGQVISPRYLQPGHLQTRLIWLTLVITLPLLTGTALFLTNIAQRALEENAVNTLRASTTSLAETIEIWLNDNVRALKATAASPAITSMDAAQQEPVLKTLVSNYPYIYLASTTDLRGINVARSDGRAATNYSDRAWFQQASGAGGRAALPISYQSLVGRTNNRPALVIAIPIRDPSGQVTGVSMAAFQLDQISRLVELPEYRHSEAVFVVDQEDQLIIHTNSDQSLLKDMSEYPPVKTLRSGTAGGDLRFIDTDANGKEIPTRAHITLLSNGWGIVAQQSEAELFAPIRTFRQLTLVVLIVGALILVALSWPTIRQAIHPVFTLTETAVALGQGDLSITAPVQSRDELGVLAETFNQMTAQLRDLIGGLEARVSERTRDLEQRAIQLQVAAEVAREAAAITAGARDSSGSGDANHPVQADPEQILSDVVGLISEKFGFYHAGIFLVSGPVSPRMRRGVRPGDGNASGDASDDLIARYAVLRAASSEGGRRMLARGHRLRVGREGIVGFVAASGQPRIALDVGKDAIFFNNPDLPQTRSELALPLKIQERVIGVLDVQSRKPSAFSQEDVTILQVLADQVSLALENARLLAESQAALRELESLYSLQVTQGWQKRLQNQPLTYVLDAGEVRPRIDNPQLASVYRQGEMEDGYDGTGEATTVEVPITLRGHTLGVLRLGRESQALDSTERTGWTPQERALLQDAANQIALSLENARLLEEVQERANQEELINQVVTRVQGSLNLDTVMKTAVQEISRVTGGGRVRLWLQETTDGRQAGIDNAEAPEYPGAEDESKEASHGATD